MILINVPVRGGTREEMLGDKNFQSANSERSKQKFYGPHLSDWLKYDKQVTEVPTVHSNFQKCKCQRDGGLREFFGAPAP